MSAGGGGKGVNLELSLSLRKEKVGMGDRIPLKMTLRNMGNGPVTVNKRFLVNDRAAPPEFRDVFLTIKMPGGGTAEFAWDLKVGFPGPKDFRKLDPGDAVSRTIDVGDLYFLTKRGKHTIKATYRNANTGPTVYDQKKAKFQTLDFGAAQVRVTDAIQVRIQ